MDNFTLISISIIVLFITYFIFKNVRNQNKFTYNYFVIGFLTSTLINNLFIYFSKPINANLTQIIILFLAIVIISISVMKKNIK